MLTCRFTCFDTRLSFFLILFSFFLIFYLASFFATLSISGHASRTRRSGSRLSRESPDPQPRREEMW